MTTHPAPRSEAHAILTPLGCKIPPTKAGGRCVRSPIAGEVIAEILPTSDQGSQAIAAAQAAFAWWRDTPAPRRGALLRLLGDELCAARRQTGAPGGHDVQPALAETAAQEGPVLRETFAPILYVMRHTDPDPAIAMHNAVPQGLASCMSTND